MRRHLWRLQSTFPSCGGSIGLDSTTVLAEPRTWRRASWVCLQRSAPVRARMAPRRVWEWSCHAGVLEVFRAARSRFVANKTQNTLLKQCIGIVCVSCPLEMFCFVTGFVKYRGSIEGLSISREPTRMSSAWRLKRRILHSNSFL